MRADLAAHLNLLVQFRDHVRTVPAKSTPPAEKFVRVGRRCRKLEIDGALYESAASAAKAFRCDSSTIYRWIKDGRARYLG